MATAKSWKAPLISSTSLIDNRGPRGARPLAIRILERFIVTVCSAAN